MKQSKLHRKDFLDKGVPKEKLMHVFHQGDNFKWLDKIVSLEPRYIALSPANDKCTSDRSYWLDECMKYVCIKKKPLARLHGLAVTSPKLINRYPWYSVDSATWIISAGLGIIFMPGINGKGEVDWKLCNPTPISDKSSHKKTHINKIPKLYRESYIGLINDSGFNLFDLTEDYWKRRLWNIFYFLNMQRCSSKKVVFAGFPVNTNYELTKAAIRAATKIGLDSFCVLNSFEYVNDSQIESSDSFFNKFMKFKSTLNVKLLRDKKEIKWQGNEKQKPKQKRKQRKKQQTR